MRIEKNEGISEQQESISQNHQNCSREEQEWNENIHLDIVHFSRKVRARIFRKQEMEMIGLPPCPR